MAFSDEKIKLMMKNLKLTRAEAIQLLQDDEDDISVELTDDQKKVVKKMTQGDRKKETAPRKRERKPDLDKRTLIDFFNSSLIDFLHESDFDSLDDNVCITNPEREIEFTFKNVKYRLTLMKPREKKGE